MAVDKTKNTQVLVTIPNDMLKQIEQFWHSSALKNRNEAIRELLRKGLERSE